MRLALLIVVEITKKVKISKKIQLEYYRANIVQGQITLQGQISSSISQDKF